MSARAWHDAYRRNKPARLEYERRHKPTRAAWWARLLGLFWPRIREHNLAERVRRWKIDAKARLKKRVHEQKTDPEAFQRKYGKPKTITTGGDRAAKEAPSRAP